MHASHPRACHRCYWHMCEGHRSLRIVSTACRRPRFMDAKALAQQPGRRQDCDRPAKSTLLGDMFVPHLTACRATRRHLKCAGSSQDETSRAGRACITRYCRDSRAPSTHWSTAKVSSDSCEEIGEDRPMLSGPSSISFLSASESMTGLLQENSSIPLHPHESERSSLHAPTSGRLALVDAAAESA